MEERTQSTLHQHQGLSSDCLSESECQSSNTATLIVDRDYENRPPSPSLPPLEATVVATTSAVEPPSPLLATANNTSIVKQRRRRRQSQVSAAENSNSTAVADDDVSNVAIEEDQPGAVQVDERAPHINHRFFQGLTRPGQRARAREERAAARRQQQQQQQLNQGSVDEPFMRLDSTNGDSNHGINNSHHSYRRGLFSRFATHSTLRPDDNSNHHHHHLNNEDLDIGLVSATLVNEDDIIFAQVVEDNDGVVLPPPDSDVERIVRRLELRNANRVPVPFDVKHRFLRLCDEACKKRLMMRNIAALEEEDGLVTTLENGSLVDNSARSGDCVEVNGIARGNYSGNGSKENIKTTSPCILREDIINLRNSTRLDVENRTRLTQITDGIMGYFGFRCHSKVLLHVFNRAVDLIDSSSHVEAQRRRRNGGKSGEQNESGMRRGSSPIMSARGRSGSITHNGIIGSHISVTDTDQSQEHPMDQQHTMDDNGNNNINNNASNNIDTSNRSDFNQQQCEEDAEWFYYKDFSFYNLKVESNYPWMRSAAAKSMLLTLAFLLFTPVLWCGILRDENICPSGWNSYNGWVTSLHFATVTMSTVGYGTTTVMGGGYSFDDGNPLPERWRIFIATLFMILSLVVSVVGFQAGLETSFHPFRRRLNVFGRRVYEILRDANIVKGANDKHEDIVSRMRWAKFSQLVEISLIFFILNLVGVFAVQLSLLGQEENEFGEVFNISWMESLYWAVQTTTTIGYGDVDIPDSLRWFLLFYLAISTYFVGSAFGKLRELNANLESMQKLYLWQQQEASYTMLADFSGRPDDREHNKNGGEDEEDHDEHDILDPEIDQFEFTIASLVLLGKITSSDVRPILEKFKKLTGDNNKITAADVSGPIKKKEEAAVVEESDNSDEESAQSSLADGRNEGVPSPHKSSGSNAFSVGKKIAQAFREEVLSSNVVAQDKENATEDDDSAVDHSKFRIPKGTYAIAIDDSKIQRKLLGKLLEFAGISSDCTTIVGDGYDEIMGFEDYVVNFMENHVDNYVFLLVDENLDVVDESSNHVTISGSLCVENIRRRLPSQLERRMFALVRSANDSSSDISIYRTRAHGFLPKAPIKRDRISSVLAPLWAERFPPSEFGETLSFGSRNNEMHSTVAEDVACTPYDIAQKVTYIESLFQNDVHVSDILMIHDQMHELKGDLLTMNSTIPVTTIVGHINLILVAQVPETVVDNWRYVRDHVNDVVNMWQKTFRIPENTYAIAIDDSKIQRKLLAKFFDFMAVPREQTAILGDGAEEIKGFEDFVVGFMENHKNDYVFMIVDENLDVVNESSMHESISGSACVESIRNRLPHELERRVLAVVRSANDSSTDISLFCTRAHGFLPKAPIRREKVNDVIAPLWLKRFPLSEFGDSVRFDADDTMSVQTDSELACSPEDIAQKLMDIESLFQKDVHFTSWHTIHDQLHMLKGDLLTLNSDSSMISVLGMINLMLLGHSQDPPVITEKWYNLRDRIHVDVIRNKSQAGEKSVERPRRESVFRLKKKQLSSNVGLWNSFLTTESLDTSRSKYNHQGLSNSYVSTASSRTSDFSTPSGS